MSVLSKIEQLVPGIQGYKTYKREYFSRDIVAGLSVAAVALPVGIAYSEIAGVAPVVGIYAAIFPLIAYAFFGSSRQLMTGPDAATCLMAAAAVGALSGGDPQRHATLMVALTLITGVCYLGAGFARLGFVANFLSHPILVGYLHGIAIIILIDQMPKLLGFTIDGEGFLAKSLEFARQLNGTHPITLAVGGSLLLLLISIKYFSRVLPGPFIVVALGILASQLFELEAQGVAVLGEVPAGLPPFRLPTFELNQFPDLVRDAVGLVLISFTSGVLTSKSFARRSGYSIDANQELIGFGAANLASGLAQGFPVTGADSRTAVNNATGGRTQLVGLIAAFTMLGILFFLTSPMSMLPETALAAIIIVSVFGFFDFAALKTLWHASRRELLFSLATTGGVLLFGVLPGVLFAVVLSLIWLLSVATRPYDAVLGKVSNVEGFHDLDDYPKAQTIPGLLMYRFDADLVFFNCDQFEKRIEEEIQKAETPIEWVIIDARPINIIDYTGIQKLQDLREELEDRGIELVFTGVKHHLSEFFRSTWVERRENELNFRLFPSIESAMDAFKEREDRSTQSSKKD
ncbi:Sodium-independent anion transporter [Planctomycetales bacterium 10988]|nr:Sodium-independent anion transporter [Planctomycetales bacterium 10988]